MKVKVARGLIGFYITMGYVKEMKGNYEEGDWLEAAYDTGRYALVMTPVVAPRLFFGTIAFPVVVGAAIGVTATAVIVEATGIGEWEEVVELALDPPFNDWVEVVVPAIQSEITEPIIEYIETTWEEQIVQPISGYVEEKKRQAISTFEIARVLFKEQLKRSTPLRYF